MNRRGEYTEEMRSRESSSSDLVVAPNEYAYVSDQTKGNVNVHVGPLKTSLAGTDLLVVFDYETKRFKAADMLTAIKTFATAPEGWYLVLKNPEREGKQPQEGKADVPRQLTVGRKVNISGPISFALWPGQMFKTVKGHILRSNQFLVVRVYDEASARENWKTSVIKRADGEETTADEVMGDVDLTMGKLFIIEGTEVSFYIPPTGVEVVAESDGEYVRDAVTLERLEYCILKDENGKKRYMKGPDVIFPKPTEIFLRKDNSRKFKAYELSPISGLYIKVIADYEDSDGEHKIGDELFITGADQMIYFPREEHAIMKYGEKDKHYATAIPAGEARYVLNRLDGKIRLEVGPSMFLPDPRNEVLVRRVLSIKDVGTWFPGNTEALKINKDLASAQASDSDGYVTADALESFNAPVAARGAYQTKQVYDDAEWDSREKAVRGKMADSLQRKTTYTKPRQVTIDSKYEGAVVIDVWTGYAVKIKSKTGTGKIIIGPSTIMLEYDESLEHMELSTSTPKTDDRLFKTAYLRVLNNKVSDIIIAETKDNCSVRVKLSYRMNFEGDKGKWFDVENYVKFMCDHMRSFGKGLIKNYGIEEFYANPHEIIREAFLGKQDEQGDRPGRNFSENGMRIYEVEILEVRIGDKQIEQMLIENQNQLVRQAVKMASMKRTVELEKEMQALQREKADALATTRLAELGNQIEETAVRQKAQLAEAEKSRILVVANNEVILEDQNGNDIAAQAELGREKALIDLQLEKDKAELEMKLKELVEEVDAVVKKGGAISPHLVAALQTLGDKNFAAALSENMSVQAMLGGKSVVEIFQNLLGENKLGKIGKKLLHEDYDSDLYEDHGR